MSDPTPEKRLNVSRRRVLAVSGAGISAAVAGCLGDDDDDDEETAPTDDEPATDDDQTEPDEEDDTEEQQEEDLPDPTDTESALIEPATLHEWHEAGLVNKDDPGESARVAVLRAWDTEEYEDGHIPGAVPWEVENFHAERLEGLANAVPMVATGDQIDTVIDQAGICPRTTIVLSGPSALRTARAYWTLRYWGFPRERVKVLNGGYHEYGEEYTLEDGRFNPLEIPDAQYSVQAHEELNNDLRLGIAQTIQRVDLIQDGERDDVILENRAPEPDTVIHSARWDNPANYHEGGEYNTGYAEGGRWKQPEEIESYVSNNLGIDSDDTIVTYCGSGYRATMSFFALDGILGYDDVTVYDGSFSRQWNQYAGEEVPEQWRVDMHGRTDGEFEPAGIDIAVDATPALDSADANQVESADMSYMAGGEAGDDTGGEGGDWGCDSIGFAFGD